LDCPSLSVFPHGQRDVIHYHKFLLAVLTPGSTKIYLRKLGSSKRRSLPPTVRTLEHRYSHDRTV
jgi:hypothetical protein